jgi:hypothetical protein
VAHVRTDSVEYVWESGAGPDASVESGNSGSLSLLVDCRSEQLSNLGDEVGLIEEQRGLGVIIRRDKPCSSVPPHPVDRIPLT